MVKHIGDTEVIPIPLSHPNGGYGYKIVEGNTVLVFLTDNELGFQHPGGRTREEYVQFCTGADLLVHDAQYTKDEYERRREWGHSTYHSAMLLSLDARVRRLLLFHHDPDRSDGEIDRVLQACQTTLSERKSRLYCTVAGEGREIQL